MDRASLRRLAGIAVLIFSQPLFAQQAADRHLPQPNGKYIPPSEKDGEDQDQIVGERPHTIIESAQREFDQRLPEPADVSTGPAGTVSIDEMRHPLSGKGARLIEKGQRFSNAGQHQNAIDEFHQALQERSAAPYAHGLLGVEYLKMNTLSEAIPELRAATEALPGVAANHTNLGLALCLAGKRTAAERELREAIRLDSISPQPRFLLGLLLLDQQSPEALEHLRLAQRIIKRARLALAIFHKRHGEEDAARQDLHAFFGSDWLKEGDNAEKWVALAARMNQPSILFGLPDRDAVISAVTP